MQPANLGYNQTPHPNIAPTGVTATPNFAVLNQPVVQDMALQYGQQVKFS